MRVEIVDNVSREMISVLSAAIEHSSDIRIAVAFVSRRGLAMLEAPVAAAMQTGGRLEFLIGLDMRSTEPEAVQALYELSRRNAAVDLYCYASLSPTSIYHPKLYILNAGNDVTSIIGSSNLTEGGLGKNVEANIRDEIVSDIYGTYNQLKFHPKRVVPDDELIALYAQLCARAKKQQRQSRREKPWRELTATFSQKTQSLRRPVPTRRDLVGWLELVYDALPEGKFTNQQVYSHEQAFHQYYPQNLNIRAKIRQQLQTLRHVGFVEHLGTGRWRKV